MRIALPEAIRRAQANEPAFAAAGAASRSARIDAYLARASLLPSATFQNQVLYTQPNGTHNQAGQTGSQVAPIFIANNAVREYASQGVVRETIGVREIADAQIASANAARATAELEVARRGLVAAVVALYYDVAAAQDKVALEEDGLAEARNFTRITRQREAVREVAHADVVKAELQMDQRQSELADATAAAERARLELGVLLFPDPRTRYTTDPPDTAAALPSHEELETHASENNPELRSALAGVAAADAGVRSAKAAYLPDFGFAFTYGIDAPQFATRGPNGVQNLGYSVAAGIDIPVWDWLSTQKRVRQSELQRSVAGVTMAAAQRRLVATIEEAYTEAATARQQLTLLDERVRTAAESLKLTKLRYAAGESTALEVVDAQDAYVTARIAHADGLTRFAAARAALDLLTGSL